ncbi:DUF4229 domain-containing protein [Rhodococcus sp. IEGM 1408]|uniref:DUF4229 domain-containing protein n=1 Tax=Rhodococcus sp. IEGM 1408 TaxID=3082220 RepID=UPI00295310B0|nr:DUF4229 domain-containing protein [Rhodococcus sp. IEGM 1408]MDV8001342.1 DUF4229 domain-containing protein [Rhodococcus sp. IEGM 1408]
MSEPDNSTHAASTHPAPSEVGAKPGGRLARNMALYTVLRLVLVLALALLIIGIGLLVDVKVPVIVAAIIAVVIALPLSMILFTRMRADINSDIAAVDVGRREKREDLRRRMDEA